MPSPAAPTSARTQERALQEPWRRRLVRTLLYGKSVDRAVKARARIGLAIIAFGVCYAVIAGRLVMYAATDNTTVRRSYSADAVATARPDILDRNGEILATDVRMPSLFAEPHRIIDKDEAVELLATVIPDLDVAEVRERLSSRRRFVWLRREITAKQRQEIHRLGLPGVGFMHENKRVYPSGPLVSHLIGHVNIDNQGIAGIEKWLDSRGLADLHLAGLARDRLQQPVELAVDMRVQHAIRDELIKARVKYKALAAAGLVLDARTGEIVSMVSVPDYDPNNPREALDPTRINRLTTGVYEMGSTFKALTLAMALDSGKMNINSMFDARGTLQYGKHTIHDYRGQNRMLSMGEVFTYSSNIGTARMALALGVEHHKQFLRRLGQLDRLRTELPESAEPIVPRRWQEINTVTIAFGHGLSVAPLAGDDGERRAGEWRLADPADLPQAHRRRGDAGRDPRAQAGHQREDALPDAAQRREGHRQARRRRRLLCRRQDRHLGEGRQRPLRQEQAAQHLHRGVPRRQAALSPAGDARRAAGDPGDPRLCHLGLERGADRRPDHRAHCTAACNHPAFRPADGGPADPGERAALTLSLCDQKEVDARHEAGHDVGYSRAATGPKA